MSALFLGRPKVDKASYRGHQCTNAKCLLVPRALCRHLHLYLLVCLNFHTEIQETAKLHPQALANAERVQAQRAEDVGVLTDHPQMTSTLTLTIRMIETRREDSSHVVPIEPCDDRAMLAASPALGKPLENFNICEKHPSKPSLAWQLLVLGSDSMCLCPTRCEVPCSGQHGPPSTLQTRRERKDKHFTDERNHVPEPLRILHSEIHNFLGQFQSLG